MTVSFGVGPVIVFQTFLIKSTASAAILFIASHLLPVFPLLIKSPYKSCFLNIPLFMRVRKRFDAEKKTEKMDEKRASECRDKMLAFCHDRTQPADAFCVNPGI